MFEILKILDYLSYEIYTGNAFLVIFVNFYRNLISFMSNFLKTTIMSLSTCTTAKVCLFYERILR